MGKIQFPRGIGRDVSGVIEKVGEGVKKFQVGDKVYSRIDEKFVGTMAEYVISNSADVALIPSNLNHGEAASVPLAGLTSYQALINVAKLSAGESILIHAGSGGVGTIGIQLAKHLGANVTTTTSTKNIDLVKSLGADNVIDYTKQSYFDQSTKFDVVFDTLGGKYTLDSFKVLKAGGRVVSIAGELDSVTTKQLGLNKIVSFILAIKAKKITKVASKMGALYRFLLMSPNGEELEELSKLYELGSIKPVIDKTYNFDDSIKALDYLSKGRATGKVVVNIRE
jgi:alcohol dehydrogenase